MVWIETFLAHLHAWQWLGILVARIAVGLIFFLSGRGKLFVPERRASMFETLVRAGVPLPAFNTIFVSIIEFLFGALLVVGFLTPLDCFMLGCVMIVALATTALKQIKSSSLLGWLSEFFYLPEVLYLVILFWIFFSGAGWLSIDYLVLSQLRV